MGFNHTFNHACDCTGLIYEEDAWVRRCRLLLNCRKTDLCFHSPTMLTWHWYWHGITPVLRTWSIPIAFHYNLHAKLFFSCIFPLLLVSFRQLTFDWLLNCVHNRRDTFFFSLLNFKGGFVFRHQTGLCFDLVAFARVKLSAVKLRHHCVTNHKLGLSLMVMRIFP